MENHSNQFNLRSKAAFSSFTIIVAFVAIALAGLAVIPYLTVKLNPSSTYNSMTVNFSMSGNSARIVEMEASSKLEGMLARINGVKSIKSTSSNGRGTIRLELDKHTSMDLARLEASTIIRQTWPSLPPSVGYPSITVNSPDAVAARPFLVYNINSTVSPNLIKQYVDKNIQPVLSQIPGIFKVDVTGATPMEWMLEYDITQLDALGITVNDIREAISTSNDKRTFGMAMVEDKETDKRYVRLSTSIAAEPRSDHRFHPEDIYLTNRDGQLIRLDRLVRVTYREEPPSNYFRINGLSSIYLHLTATDDANQIRLSKAVKDEMANIKKMLPKGYEMYISYDATERIYNELNKIYIRTVFTVIILLVLVFLTTFNARYLLLILLSLFFNIAIAFIFYYIFGLEIQLYSLAGITISLSLIIDNTIIMADHYMRNRDRKAIFSILTATITTVGALVMIYFLDENIRLNLQDFATVVIINLMVSLSVSSLFVPAVIEKLNIKRKRFKIKRLRFNPKRLDIYFNRLYLLIIRFLLRFRTVTLILLVVAFGLPVFMLPTKMEGDGKWAQRYNKIVSTAKFKDKVRPIIEKSLGGTLRLFVQKVFTGGNYFNRTNDETVLSVTATLPNGATLDQMNYMIRQMESFLSEFKEIRQFQANIFSARRASIRIYFTNSAEKSGFPYQLHSNIVSKVTQISGGGSWSVSGLPQQWFSNEVREQAGNTRVKFYGYNYDDLYSHASEFRDSLLSNRRIKEVFINSEYMDYKDDYVEFLFDLDKQRMAVENIRPNELYNSLSPVFIRDNIVGHVIGEEQNENIKLSSKQSRLYDLWNLANMSRTMNGKNYKIGELTKITKGQTPQNIVKEQQQYILLLQYDYVGAAQQGNNFIEGQLKQFNKAFPLGYSAERVGSNYSFFSKKDNKQYLLLGLIIVIIFFMTSILFNSLKQPLAIIFIIPVSYIGVFLTFYLFRLGFDAGGFASFVLLCGITINASIYLVNEYNRILRRKPKMNPVKAYIKSWNIKIVPIFLTIISTILGLIPFMVGLGRESFWFPLAVGTIGGLIMSFIGIFFFLPLFLIKRRLIIPKRKKKRNFQKVRRT